MKRGGRPKTLPTSSPCATASTGTGGSWTEASAVAAERLADWQQNLSDQVSYYNYLPINFARNQDRLVSTIRDVCC